MNFEKEELQKDFFDQLPDALLLEIFNRVQDAKSLSSCTSLCKRFASLVPQTDVVSLTISRRNILPPANPIPNSNSLKGFINRAIFKPIQSFLQLLLSEKSKNCRHCDGDGDGDFSFRLPNEMLKSFKEIRSLVVKLPSHDGDISPESSSGAMLKWTAEFGKELESCVMIGATGFRKSEEMLTNNEMINDNLTNKQLKKRVVWAISCLIASSARHHMLKQIVTENRVLRDVEICDESKQGSIRMREKQIGELREEMGFPAVGKPGCEVERTKVPAVTIKMWYVPSLELPESGYVMKGATLAVMKPVVGESGSPPAAEDCGGLAVSGFWGGEGEKWFEEAVRKLLTKKKAYTLEMNSF